MAKLIHHDSDEDLCRMTDYDAPRQNMRCTIESWDITTTDLFRMALRMSRRSVRDTSPLPAWFQPRPLAVIEAEIARATVPGLRPEQV